MNAFRSFGDTVRKLKGRNKKHAVKEFCDLLAMQLGVMLKLIQSRDTLHCAFGDPLVALQQRGTNEAALKVYLGDICYVFSSLYMIIHGANP